MSRALSPSASLALFALSLHFIRSLPTWSHVFWLWWPVRRQLQYASLWSSSAFKASQPTATCRDFPRARYARKAVCIAWHSSLSLSLFALLLPAANLGQRHETTRTDMLHRSCFPAGDTAKYRGNGRGGEGKVEAYLCEGKGLDQRFQKRSPFRFNSPWPQLKQAVDL